MTDDTGFSARFMYGRVDTRAGFLKALEVFVFSKFVIISVFVCNGAMGNPLVTAIADIRSFIEMVGLPRSCLKLGQAWLQVGQKAHLMPQRKLFPYAFVFLQ